MIDVIIPAYNCSGTLGRTLSSLASQADKAFRAIIVDDCSSEDIRSIVEQYNGLLNITYLRNDENIGCGMSRQVGIDNSTASHFCFLDADDMFMPYTVEMFNSVIAGFPEVELLCGDFYQQAYIKGHHTMVLHKDGFTYCHGKLYNSEKIRYYGIRNRPDVKYADDSFFNSICFELLQPKRIEIPLYFYTENPLSVTRRRDLKGDNEVLNDFLRAMIWSCETVRKFKPAINHLPYTLKRIRQEGRMTEETRSLYTELEKYANVIT